MTELLADPTLVRMWIEILIDLGRKIAGIFGTDQESVVVPSLIISPEVLISAVKDIQAVETRFSQALADPTRTILDNEVEQQLARQALCRHLNLIRELNGSMLPTDQLTRLWQSYQCHT